MTTVDFASKDIQSFTDWLASMGLDVPNWNSLAMEARRVSTCLVNGETAHVIGKIVVVLEGGKELVSIVPPRVEVLGVEESKKLEPIDDCLWGENPFGDQTNAPSD